MNNNGKLIGIARTAVRLGPMEEIPQAIVSEASGIAGDTRGHKKRTPVSVLFRADWEAACRDTPGGAILPWTVRRANLYVDGLTNPRAAGGRIRVGEVLLEVTCETEPCDLMERAQAGLRAAMTPHWRGGVCCIVLGGGTIRLGDGVCLLNAP